MPAVRRSGFSLALDPASRVLQSTTEIVVAPHLDAELVEVRLGRFDGRGLLTVQERHLHHRQVGRFGEQVPRLGRVARVLGIGQIPADLDAEFSLVRFGDGNLALGVVSRNSNDL